MSDPAVDHATPRRSSQEIDRVGSSEAIPNDEAIRSGTRQSVAGTPNKSGSAAPERDVFPDGNTLGQEQQLGRFIRRSGPVVVGWNPMKLVATSGVNKVTIFAFLSFSSNGTTPIFSLR